MRLFLICDIYLFSYFRFVVDSKTVKVSDKMSINKTTLVESLGDGDLATLALATSSERYSSSDFETLEDIQAELECMNAEEVITSQEEEAETIIPDIEMTDLSSSEVQSEQIVYTTANQNNQNVIFQTKPTLQRVPVSAMQARLLVFLKSDYDD